MLPSRAPRIDGSAAVWSSLAETITGAPKVMSAAERASFVSLLEDPEDTSAPAGTSAEMEASSASTERSASFLIRRGYPPPLVTPLCEGHEVEQQGEEEA